MGMDILSRIVEYKKEEIRKLQRIRPEAVLRAEAEGVDICRRSFINHLSDRRSSDIRIIAEIKRASPSRGDIRMDLDVAQSAAAYERGGAAAVSILTESRWFKGGVEDLIIARRATALPVLRKDFIVSTYQIYESAVIGADAVLLIARILSKNQLEEYLALCAAYKMDALVEVHTTEDLETIKNIDARLIGINNRNLTSFKTDIRHAVNLSARLADFQVPVALSGIHTREDIEQTAQAGICNFLIGESIMRSSDPEKFIRSLLTPGV